MEQTSSVKSANSLLPLGMTGAVNSVAANVSRNVSKMMPAMPSMPAMPTMPDMPWAGIGAFTALVVVFLVLLYFFNRQITDGFNKIVQSIRSTLGMSSHPPPPVETTMPTTMAPPQPGDSNAPPNTMVEKILPQNGTAQVFNVSKNTFTYYDAEPLCRALGAELATYDQVKQSWEQGADWCNYGWVKGQMALYPTQKETWEKLQQGPESERRACGNPGLNGGYFDNPEMRFGVNCYGLKPSQSAHDAAAMSSGVPQSPAALEFDKKVTQFKSESDNIGVLPFSTNKWSS